MAVKKDDVPYTSASTAENQNVSEKVYAKPPIKPLPKIAIVSPNEGSSFLVINRLVKWVIDQKRNSIVKALARAERIFIITAALCGPAKRVKNLPIIIKRGAPGGCPTSSLNAVVMNSPQSQKLAVGSIVKRYVMAATKNVNQPTTMFSFL